MAYLELSMELGALDAERAESACFDAGALSVSFTDVVDEPVLEPKPGEMRLWRRTRLQALFASEQADVLLLARLSSALGVEPIQLQARALQERIWEREWLRDFHAMRFGQRLWICPHHEQVDEPGAVVVTLDPGLAFGTGTHATTALCLEWLDAMPLAGRSVIDYGCGSGVLAVAALRLGAQAAWGYDIDPQALTASCENATANRVQDRLQLCERASQLPESCDALLANILAEVLIELAPQLAARVRDGGDCVLSGILSSQADSVAEVFATWFDVTCFGRRDGWVALSGRRRATPH